MFDDDFGEGGTPVEHPSESELAGYLEGTLSPSELSEMDSHLEACGECRQAIVFAARVVDAATPERTALRAMRPTPRTRSLRRTGPWLLTSAALAASIAGVLFMRIPAPTADSPERVRVPAAGEGTPLLMVVSPANGGQVDPARPVFTWRSESAGQYRFVLLRPDGTQLWSNETTDTTLVLPAEIVLEPAVTYLWRVDAMAGGISATTRTQRFSIER